MIKKLLNPSTDRADLILRIALGIVFFAHGSQKIFGWFGGFGWTGTLGFFQQAMGIPPFLAGLSFLAEFVGGVLILLGLLTRPAALAIAVTILVAGLKVGLPNGFFLDSNGPNNGIEYVFVLFLLAIYFVIKGSGRISLDSLLSKRNG
ncbi:DoxX family protein [Desulfitobacterium sp.]|uniref:DoxX family protein n=1 Tax=Desulfitobacterium sp. TaxID=49981 RepID=UPI002B63389D|nr:DoxX family protein [Desulfitobacterium sp.]HVJ49700.1 DoxX family protein [Desulfitobacterium sp.]